MGSGSWREGRLSADYVVERIGIATEHEATWSATSARTRCGRLATSASATPTGISRAVAWARWDSVPAAMGAALGAPERETWAITGDGGFQMTMQELATLVQDQIPVRIAVLNNHRLGMIRQWQEIIYDENYHSAELIGPDLVRLCEAYGIPAWRATKLEEVDGDRRGAQRPARRSSTSISMRRRTSIR